MRTPGVAAAGIQPSDPSAQKKQPDWFTIRTTASNT
ncbi:hypothetical protein N579_0113450 [Corynebacterium pseudodiphtheriticum 090104]|nr:hypothetical protein N579_0113450 [Corynebacterium pseudodiphtheriticum 090104]